jgi:hypothetical protein
MAEILVKSFFEVLLFFLAAFPAVRYTARSRQATATTAAVAYYRSASSP